MHYCRQFVHRSRACLYCTEPSTTLYPKGICNYDRTLWRWQCSTTMTHFPWAWQTLSPLSGVQEKGRTEVKSNPTKCLFKYNDRPTRKVESALDSQVPMYTSRYEVISDTSHVWLAWEPFIHVHRAFCSPPHSNASTFKAQSYIQKGLRTFDDAWQFFTSIHAEWLCVGGCEGWMELCVCGREEVEQNQGPGKSDCVELLLTGKWGWVGLRGWRCKGLRLKSGATDGWKKAALWIAAP